MLDPLAQPLEIEMLIFERVERLGPALAYLMGELDHLIDALLAGEPVHKLGDDLGQRLLRLVLRRLEQELDHHGDHHLRPALAQQRDGAVKVKERVADALRAQGGVDDFDLAVRKKRHSGVYSHLSELNRQGAKNAKKNNI